MFSRPELNGEKNVRNVLISSPCLQTVNYDLVEGARMTQMMQNGTRTK